MLEEFSVRKKELILFCSYPLLVMVVIFVGGWITSGTLFYPIDDAYIYAQQAVNLANGYFLKYSVFDEATNSNSSFLYYLILAFFCKVALCLLMHG